MLELATFSVTELNKCLFPLKSVSQRRTAAGQAGNTGFLMRTGIFLMPGSFQKGNSSQWQKPRVTAQA